MELCELVGALIDVIDNNDNNLKSSYELLIRPVLDKFVEDANLLYQNTNRTPKEIKQLDIKTFYIEVNLCKTIKKIRNP